MKTPNTNSRLRVVLALSTTTFVPIYLTTAFAAPPLAAQRLAAQQSTATGKVDAYLLNPHGEVDGLLLSNGASVRVPPHMGEQLAQSVAIGDEITASGPSILSSCRSEESAALKATPAMRADSITNKSTGKTIVDTPPATRRPSPEERGLKQDRLSDVSILKLVTFNDRCEADGLVLSDGTQVKFKPHNGIAFLRTNPKPSVSKVIVSGLGVKNRFGLVIDATTLSIDNAEVPLTDVPVESPVGPAPSRRPLPPPAR